MGFVIHCIEFKLEYTKACILCRAIGLIGYTPHFFNFKWFKIYYFYEEDLFMNIEMAVDTLWVLLAGALVFFMNLGFACVEAGFARSKNTVNILSKNFIVFAVSSLGYLLLGWGLMFGGDNPFVGTKGVFILGGNIDESLYTLNANVPFWGKFFFQLVFCGTAATIVSGAVAERVKYISFILFSFVLTLVIYPIVGHWIWGGGFLASLGFKDFAGSTVVHSLGGWAALAGVIVLGPRFGKYGKDGKVKPIPGHDMSLATIGLFVLWLGWFGFNPGSTMSMANPKDVTHILMTTNTGAIAGVLASTVISWTFLGKPDLGMTINGCLAGLVAVTAGCAYIDVLSSLIIGATAGIIVVFAVLIFDKLKIDDPVGATSVHLVNGVFGTICVGLFAKEGVTTLSSASGLFFGGGLSLLGTQLLGILAVAVFVFPGSLLVWVAIKKTLGIRVTLAEEITGLDIEEHGNSAYPEFLSRKPAYSAIVTGNSKKAEVYERRVINEAR
jgi:ammonium transporter, Amt family